MNLGFNQTMNRSHAQRANGNQSPGHISRKGVVSPVNYVCAMLIGLLVSALVATATAATATALQPLVSAEALSSLIDRKAVVVIDVREVSASVPAEFIPRSVSLPYSFVRGPANNPGQLVSAEQLSKRLSGLGISLNTPLVIAHGGIDASDFGAAARVYWTLKIAGFTNLAILNGGVNDWQTMGFPMASSRLVLPATSLSLLYDQRQIVTRQEIASLLKSTPPNATPPNATPTKASRPLLLDARPLEYFIGLERHPAAARFGTLPGAAHFDQEDWFVEDSGLLKPFAKLQALAKDRNLITDTETISFCNAGHWSATNWFVLSEMLGQKNNRMYPESMVAWSLADLPMENEPGRLTVLWRDLKESVANLIDVVRQPNP
jgi:thiosulfate/3-mercaptopyruvate sulfurtransferase